MGVSNSNQIKSRGQGNIQIPVDVTSASVTIPLVNPAKTVLKLLGLKPNIEANESTVFQFSSAMAMISLENETTIKAKRMLWGSGWSSLVVQFEYMEFY